MYVYIFHPALVGLFHVLLMSEFLQLRVFQVKCKPLTQYWFTKCVKSTLRCQLAFMVIFYYVCIILRFSRFKRKSLEYTS